jgi:uncharacterized protein YbbC (DUF1343 family)
MRSDSSRKRVVWQSAAVALAGLVVACGTAPGLNGSDADTAGASAGTGDVRTGIDVLLAEGAGPLGGRRVGLITNHTGITADGRSTIDVLHEHADLDLIALFSPEHGIRGTAEAGETVNDSVDERTGLPVHSLYGETRTPTAAMLEGLDVLAFDIQDIGTRYYTYIWTMALALETAAEHGLRFVVLDRPDPIGGIQVHGNVLDPEFATFVGLHPVPMRHGLTVGEMARYLNAELELGADLHVIPMRGWRRSAWFDETGLPWIAPSPNMPDLESAAHYPGTCLFEGTNLSVGRGTDAAFQMIGAPWLDSPGLVARLAARPLPGVRFDTVTFTPQAPGDGKFAGEAVRGIRLTVTDRRSYDPTLAAVAALVEIRAQHADRLTFMERHFDRLAGTAALRTGLLAGESVEALRAPWEAERAAFERRRTRYLLY